jgi:hypothetical protein
MPRRCKAAIPGCESLEKLSDTDFKAVVKVKIGPVSARFNGKVHLTDIDATTAIASPARAKAAWPALPRAAPPSASPMPMAAAPSSATTSDAQVGGKIAQLGLAPDRRLGPQARRRVLRQFRQGAGDGVSARCMLPVLGPGSSLRDVRDDGWASSGCAYHSFQGTPPA